jgi:DNA polymerase-3 subunit alpha
LKKEDKEFHNLFKQLAYNTVGRHEDDFPGTGYHLWTAAEMAEKFTATEIANTNEIASKCSTKFEFHKYHLPKFETPANSDAYEYLYHLSMIGMVNRGLVGNKEYEQRLEYEMQQLHLTELEDYFLIVSDYVKWCKLSGIPVGTARGSGGGSLVAWLVGITEVDPLKYDLLFARAINPGRALQYDFGV